MEEKSQIYPKRMSLRRGRKMGVTISLSYIVLHSGFNIDPQESHEEDAVIFIL